MTETAKITDQQKIDAETCPIHKTPMIRHQEHVGDGAAVWSEPYCQLCNELKAAGKYDAAMASINADNEKRKAANATPKEQPASTAVKAEPAAAPAAKA